MRRRRSATSKLLFLDVDGVLNHAAWFAAPRPRPRLDPACVQRVSIIVEATGAAVVVSSTWRLGVGSERWRLGWLQGILDAHGFKGDVVGVTPDLCPLGGPSRPRSEEIAAYLAAHPVEVFAILDDDNDVGHAAHFVQTDACAGGLTDAHTERVIEILGRTERFGAVESRIRFTEPT